MWASKKPFNIPLILHEMHADEYLICIRMHDSVAHLVDVSLNVTGPAKTGHVGT